MSEEETPAKQAPRPWWRLVVSVVRILAIVYIAFGAIVFFFQSYLIYRPSEHIEETPKDRGMDFEDVSLETEDGTCISAWYVPAGGGGGGRCCSATATGATSHIG